MAEQSSVQILENLRQRHTHWLYPRPQTLSYTFHVRSDKMVGRRHVKYEAPDKLRLESEDPPRMGDIVVEHPKRTLIFQQGKWWVKKGAEREFAVLDLPPEFFNPEPFLQGIECSLSLRRVLTEPQRFQPEVVPPPRSLIVGTDVRLVKLTCVEGFDNSFAVGLPHGFRCQAMPVGGITEILWVHIPTFSPLYETFYEGGILLGTVAYKQFRPTTQERLIPTLVEVTTTREGREIRWTFNYQWMADCAWMVKSAKAYGEVGKVYVESTARLSNVVVNGRIPPETFLPQF